MVALAVMLSLRHQLEVLGETAEAAHAAGEELRRAGVATELELEALIRSIVRRALETREEAAVRNVLQVALEYMSPDDATATVAQLRVKVER